MSSSRFIALVLIVGAIFATGCDEHVVEPDGTNEVVFDLRPLFRSADGDACATVADALILTVTDSDGEVQTAEHTLAPDDAEVRIPVEVRAGTVTFEAGVRSNNETLLYAGSTSAEVEDDGFEVEIELAAVDAVLKACPDVVPLEPFDEDYRGTIQVINRGSRAVAWQASYDAPTCDDVPCFNLTPSAATVAAGDTVSAVGRLLRTSPVSTVDVQIASAVGMLDARFVADFQPPSAVRDTVAVLEGGFTTIDVLANDVDPEGDPLTLISVGDALYGTTDLEGNVALYGANYEPVWGMTSVDRFSYVADAGGRRAEGEVVVNVVPCIAFEEETKTGQADTPLVTENGVTVTTRPFQFGDNTSGFGFVITQSVLDAGDDFGAYLTDAAVEFDWTDEPVRYVRFDFLDDAAVVNIALDGAEPAVAAEVAAAASALPGITVRVEDGKFGPDTRIVLDAGTAMIERLLLGGGDPDNELRTLVVDDVCFGVAPPTD